MTTLAVQPNLYPHLATFERHILPLPACCPVSKNPAPGSTIRISYRPSRHILEVFALNHYLRAFIGGHPDGTREMEAMIQKIALDCATALGVAVVVRADLGYGTNVYTSQALD